MIKKDNPKMKKKIPDQRKFRLTPKPSTPFRKAPYTA